MPSGYGEAPDSLKICASCAAFAPNLRDLKQGYCHRRPPVAVAIPIPQGQGFNVANLQGAFPVVMVDDWCREWEQGKLVREEATLPPEHKKFG